MTADSGDSKDTTEQRLRSLDEREHAVAERESQVEAHEGRQVRRKDEVDNVMVKAAQRDEVAHIRDAAAGKRDMAANLRAWLQGLQDQPEAEARQEAFDDRLHSAGDRKSSAVDRSILADDDEPRQPGTKPDLT